MADRDFQRLAFIAPGVQRERGSFRFINGGPVVGNKGTDSPDWLLYIPPAVPQVPATVNGPAVAQTVASSTDLPYVLGLSERSPDAVVSQALRLLSAVPRPPAAGPGC